MKKILLIEDNTEVRENTAEILELAHFEVIQAENGKIGLEMVQKHKPDLIICDVMMPLLDGYGVIHMLNKNPETIGIPFIFLTAKSDRSDFRMGMEMGADDYITKPFDDIELLKAIEIRLRKADAIKSEYSKNVEGINRFFNEVRGIDDLKKANNNRKIKQFGKKEVIYSEGNMPNYLFFLAKGKVKTFKEHKYGKEFITSLIKEGEFFGYVALLEENSYPDTAEALEESEIFLIPKEEFQNVVFGNFAATKKIIKMLSENISENEEKLVNLAYSSVRKRVADALLLLESKYKSSATDKFSMSISREDLANIVGTATESLIRTLSDFKEEKLIEIKGSNITITDSSRLKKLRA